jgi:transcriptional regulator with XRE-family HTH domain
MSERKATAASADRPARAPDEPAKRTRAKAGRTGAKAPQTTRDTLGDFLRTQRRIAGLTLRQLADITSVSNAYLSQIERDKHQPSIEVLRAVARGLNVSAETLLGQVGLFEDPASEASPDDTSHTTEAAILGDPSLTPAQREALIAVYRSYRSENTDRD